MALKKYFQLALACKSCSMQSNPASKIETPDQYILKVGFAIMMVVSGKLYLYTLSNLATEVWKIKSCEICNNCKDHNVKTHLISVRGFSINVNTIGIMRSEDYT